MPSSHRGRRLRANGHRLRFVTNTTTRSRSQLAEALRLHGIEVEDAEVQVTADAAVTALRGKRVLALTMQGSGKQLHLCDSFAGLPAPSAEDNFHHPGDFGDTDAERQREL